MGLGLLGRKIHSNCSLFIDFSAGCQKPEQTEKATRLSISFGSPFTSNATEL